MNPSALHESAPAKLNLYLHVTGRRPDGYHLLDSLVVFVDLSDRLEAVPADRLTLSLRGPFAEGIEAGEGNLVLGAANLLRETAGVREGAAIALHKNIPAGAGLGGGSADAAAALRLLMRLWRVTLPPPALHALASRLGSDVPACLESAPCTLSGVGHELRDAPLDIPAHFLLVSPRKPLLTADVYRAFDGAFTPATPFSCAGLSAPALASLLAERRNDLERPALRLLPELAGLLEALRRLPGCLLVRMSGSGSACFGLFERRAEAQRAAESLRSQRPGWWVAPASMLPPASMEKAWASAR